MLRVGLTGELGSGKSTVARLLAAHGAIVLSSDEVARAMMQPGEPVFRAIVEHFGPGVVLHDGQLNRPELARLAFDPENPRVEELNSIVHPAVLSEQENQITEIASAHPEAIIVVESALLFTTRYGQQPWRKRFDQIVLVTAQDELKIERFVKRSLAGRTAGPQESAALEEAAQLRLAAQRINPALTIDCLVIENLGTEENLARRTEEVFRLLRAAADDVQVREAGL